jgi:hypothetical protein
MPGMFLRTRPSRVIGRRPRVGACNGGSWFGICVSSDKVHWASAWRGVAPVILSPFEILVNKVSVTARGWSGHLRHSKGRRGARTLATEVELDA